MNAQLPPEDRVIQNEIICEKLLGWVKRPSDIPGISFSGWCVPNGPDESTPSFTTWADAGLILEALQANHERSFSVLRSLSKILKGGLLEPADVRAAALVHIGSSS